MDSRYSQSHEERNSFSRHSSEKHHRPRDSHKDHRDHRRRRTHSIDESKSPATSKRFTPAATLNLAVLWCSVLMPVGQVVKEVLRIRSNIRREAFVSEEV